MAKSQRSVSSAGGRARLGPEHRHRGLSETRAKRREPAPMWEALRARSRLFVTCLQVCRCFSEGVQSDASQHQVFIQHRFRCQRGLPVIQPCPCQDLLPHQPAPPPKVLPMAFQAQPCEKGYCAKYLPLWTGSLPGSVADGQEGTASWTSFPETPLLHPDFSIQSDGEIISDTGEHRTGTRGLPSQAVDSSNRKQR